MNSITIAVPVYNVESFIERCAISLFEQTYESIDYLFIDDCTPDDSIGVLKRTINIYPHRKDHVRIIRHTHNRGLAAARNTAVDNCQTEFLMHVDSDDWLEKDAVEILVNEQQKGNYDIVTGNAIIHHSDRKEELRHIKHIDKESLILECIKPSISHVIWGRLIRRVLYIDNRVAALEGINIGEDHQVIPQLFYYAKSFSFIDEFIYNYDCTNQNSYMKQTSQYEKFGLKVTQDLKSFEILRCFFEKCTPLMYKVCVEKEMNKYIHRVTPYLAQVGQKEVFNLSWSYFNESIGHNKRNILRLPQLSYLIRRNYTICRYFFRIKGILKLCRLLIV